MSSLGMSASLKARMQYSPKNKLKKRGGGETRFLLFVLLET